MIFPAYNFISYDGNKKRKNRAKPFCIHKMFQRLKLSFFDLENV